MSKGITIKDVLIRAGELQDFPYVKYVGEKKIRHHPNTIGQIKEIKPRGISVNLGLNYNKWFNAKESDDNRSTYMSQLVFLGQDEEYIKSLNLS